MAINFMAYGLTDNVHSRMAQLENDKARLSAAVALLKKKLRDSRGEIVDLTKRLNYCRTGFN